MTDLNRRDFLKLSARPCPWRCSSRPSLKQQKPRPIGLGRVTEWRIWAYNEARPGAKKEYALTRDDVIDIYATLDTEGLMAHNPVWNLTKYGWVYSSWVQPVKQVVQCQWSACAGERLLGAGDRALRRHAHCAER